MGIQRRSKNPLFSSRVAGYFPLTPMTGTVAMKNENKRRDARQQGKRATRLKNDVTMSHES
jgi:hypothetical protein